MRWRRSILLLSAIVLGPGGPWPGLASEPPAGAMDSAGVAREWRFDAMLDGRPIGRHTFRVVDRGGHVEVDSRASFDVKFLGFSVYTYEHHAREHWRDGCLATLDSRTDDNGKIEVVNGALAGDGFALTRGGTTTVLPACTMTFAYWNPAIRAQERLLNPQTGEYLGVSVSVAGAAKLGETDASRYVLRGEKLEIDLWYDSADDRWLALDSKASGGERISYRLAVDR